RSRDVVQIDGGALNRMLCALQRDGRVQCWGDNAWHDHDQDERGQALAMPTELHAVPEIFDAVEIAVGFEHACALRKGGLVACWAGFAPDVVTPIGPAAGSLSLSVLLSAAWAARSRRCSPAAKSTRGSSPILPAAGGSQCPITCQPTRARSAS